jgi:hypothetical protein
LKRVISLSASRGTFVKIVNLGKVSGEEPTIRGIKVSIKHIFDDDAPDGLNFRMVRSDFLNSDDAYTTPRHHHVFQQIRWAEVGTLNYAPGQDLSEGDVAYFPRAAYYGPQLKDSGVSLAVQFGLNGECQYGGNRKAERAAAMERLKERGKSEGGAYTDIDPDTGQERVRDSVQAIDEEQFEAATGRKFTFPAAGYESAILMHPGAFSFYEASPGVEIKPLGSFFDHAGPSGDLRLSIVRLSNGGKFKLEPDRAQIAWAKIAGLAVDGKTQPEMTFIYSPRDEAATLSSTDPVEVNVLEFPRLD